MTKLMAGAERKSLDATIEDAGDSAEKPFGGFVAVASTPSLDRDGDQIGTEEWLDLPEHITIDSDHGMSVGTTIGSARPFFDAEGRLMIDAAFSSIDRAQEVRTLIKEGHIRTVSVAFLTDRSKKDGTPRRELLNVGVVAIPSNRDAVILDAKAAKAESVSDAAVKFIQAVEAATKAGTSAGSGDGALVQAIHDAAGHLGAACIVVEVEPDGDESGAAEGANKAADLTGVVIDGEVHVYDAAKPVTDPVAKAAFTIEQFKAALDAIITTSDIDTNVGEPQGVSPVDPPVEEAAAATYVPAPADDTAESAVESEVASEKRAARMAMALFATEVLSD
jgi:hypothetical protein